MAKDEDAHRRGTQGAAQEGLGADPSGRGQVEARPLPRPLDRIDRRLVRGMRRHRIVLLRTSLGVVFLWFGLLKVFGRSPVDPLVAATVPWIATGIVVPALGVWEALVGAGLLSGRAPRTTLLMLWLLLAGTFLAFVMAPASMFQAGNPLLLTLEGEFVAKNLVLAAAGLAVGGSLVRRGDPLVSGSPGGAARAR